MQLFKKISALCLALLLALPFAACATTGEKETEKATNAESESSTTGGTQTEVTTETEAETDPVIDEKYQAIVSTVPTPEGDGFVALSLDSFIIGDGGTVTVNTISEGVYEMINTASDYSYESRSVRFVTDTDPIANYRKDLYAYMTVSFYLPEDYKTNKDLWVNDSVYMYVSIGDTHDKVAVTSSANATEIPGALVAVPGEWTTFSYEVTKQMGSDTFGFFTECNTTIYFANLGINRVINPEHVAALSTIPAIPENFHAIDVCEYDENGNETKRNIFPGNGVGSIDLTVVDVEHEMVQVTNYAGNTSYVDRSARFMGDPISQYRNMENAYFTVDIWLPDDFVSNEAWHIDDKALMYIALSDSKPATIGVNTEEDKNTENDFIVKTGQWVRFTISMKDLGKNPFGFYTASGTHFYYANMGIVVSE